MNLFAGIIVFALVGEWLLELIADILNLRHFPAAVPAPFADVYTDEDYAKSRAYARVTTRFGWVKSIVSLVTLLVFWGLGGFALLNRWVTGLADSGFLASSIVRGILFISVLAAARVVLSLPFSLYSTFVIEERFGFNKTTLKTFVADLVKSLLLGALIGWPLLAGVIWFFEVSGDLAWVFCWIFLTLVSLIIHYVAPTWIMPLFNTFTPLEDGSLKAKITAFAQKVAFPLRGVYVIDGSRRSSKGNAFFTGFGRNKRVALYDTLIEKQTEDQLVGVLAHEIGHYKKKHILIQLIIGIAQSGVMLFLLGVFLRSPGLFQAFQLPGDTLPVYAGLIFFSLLFSPVNLVLGILMNVLSRKMEYQADRFAAENTGKPEDLAEALKKLSKDSLSELSPHPLTVILHYSHPPILERLKALTE
ncbi:MAG: M48 family metallopeptidase [Lentisphaeria bacterium]|nr:M48 family metallopeptidase [Lentisphaeria bacterium]